MGEYRDHPGVNPLTPVRWALATRDSVATLTASGSAIDGGGCTNEWSGSADFLAAGYAQDNRVILARMKIDTASMTGAIGLAYGNLVAPPFSWTVTCPGSSPISTGFMVSFGLLDGPQDFSTPRPGDTPIPIPALNFPFAADFSIPPQLHVDDTLAPISILVNWGDITSVSPPDPNAARIARGGFEHTDGKKKR